MVRSVMLATAWVPLLPAFTVCSQSRNILPLKLHVNLRCAGSGSRGDLGTVTAQRAGHVYGGVTENV